MQHAALSEYRPILAGRPPSHSFSSMADRKLTLIPIIFIVLRIWSTVRFILLLVGSPARQSPVLVTLHVSEREGSFKAVTLSLSSNLLYLKCLFCSTFHVNVPSSVRF